MWNCLHCWAHRRVCGLHSPGESPLIESRLGLGRRPRLRASSRQREAMSANS